MKTLGQKCHQCLQQELVNERGILICKNPACRYVDFNPVNYDNENNDYEGEAKTFKRYSDVQILKVDDTDKDKEIYGESLEFNYHRGKTYIRDCCHLLKISEAAAEEACSLLHQILKSLAKERHAVLVVDMDKTVDDEGSLNVSKVEEKKKGKKQGKGQKIKNRNLFSVKHCSAYSIYTIMFKRQMFLQQFNILNYFSIEVKKWRDLLRQLNTILRQHLQYVPITTPKQIILKVCQKRNIASAQTQAMVQMCQKILYYSMIDVRSPTIAAISFWIICRYSLRYTQRINLGKMCQAHDRLINAGKANATFLYFDITPENVRKVYREHIHKELFKKYLPMWEGRVKDLNAVGKDQ